jgi:hypothetical protein
MLSRRISSRLAQTRFTSHIVEDVDKAASRAAVNHPAVFLSIGVGAATAMWVASVFCLEKSEEQLVRETDPVLVNEVSQPAPIGAPRRPWGVGRDDTPVVSREPYYNSDVQKMVYHSKI